MPKSIAETYRDRFDLLREVSQRLQKETEDALNHIPHIDRVGFRVKGETSFLKKATDTKRIPAYKNPLVEIEDQIAGRVIVFFHRDIEQVVATLDKTFTPVEATYRQPTRDAEFGYESHHSICLIPPHVEPKTWNTSGDFPKTFELQVRTLFMHAYAEPQHDLSYKAAEDLPQDIRRELAWIAASAWGADQAFVRVLRWQEKAQDDAKKVRAQPGDE